MESERQPELVKWTEAKESEQQPELVKWTETANQMFVSFCLNLYRFVSFLRLNFTRFYIFAAIFLPLTDLLSIFHDFAFRLLY